MLSDQRTALILRTLEKERAADVASLCRLTGASEATIRRDLSALAAEGRLRKVFGGAVALDGQFQADEPDMDTKRTLFTAEKQRIARYAAGLITPDDVVYLDAGTTVLAMADCPLPTGALFVTNSIECALRLAQKGIRAYVLGGLLKQGTVAIIGAEALASLRRYHFTKAFLGANGITAAQGFTTPDPEEAAVKALAAAQARSVFVLADSGKFGRVSPAAMFPLAGATVITDRLPDPALRDHTDIREVL